MISRNAAIEKYKLRGGQQIIECEFDGRTILVVKCKCGSVRRLTPSNAMRSMSCGCQKSILIGNKVRRHGHGSGTPTYVCWKNMLIRCQVDNIQHSRYFDRGIVVCERWHRFDNFLCDMGVCPIGMQIDRINNNGIYEPQNCRWTTSKENNRNRQSNVFVEFSGERRTLSEWSEIKGYRKGLISERIKRGWPIGRALMEPPR